MFKQIDLYDLSKDNLQIYRYYQVNCSPKLKSYDQFRTQFYQRMRSIKSTEFSPWQHQREQDFDRIPMPTRKNFQYQRMSIVFVSAENQTEPSLQLYSNNPTRQHSLSPRRQFSFRQRVQQNRVKIHLKPIDISSKVGIGNGLVGDIAAAKKKIQSKMMDYLLLIYLSEQLKQQASVSKSQIIKQKCQCLFPLIGYAGASKENYKNRSSLNDLIDFKLI